MVSINYLVTELGRYDSNARVTFSTTKLKGRDWTLVGNNLVIITTSGINRVTTVGDLIAILNCLTSSTLHIKISYSSKLVKGMLRGISCTGSIVNIAVQKK